MKKMKLTLAIASLTTASMAMAGTCGVANLSAWDNVRDDSGSQVQVIDGGLGGTTCTATFESTADNSDRGRVQDTSPSCEKSFRAKFILDVDAVGTLASNERTKLNNFQCVGSCPVGLAQFRLQGDGAGNNILRSFVADQNQADLRNRFDVPVPAGESTVEYQWIAASADGADDGVFRVWHSGNTDEASPDIELTGLDHGDDWCVTQTNLGLIQATNAWTTRLDGVAFEVDEYESRRQTGITVN